MGKTKPIISHRDFVRDLGRGALGEDVVEVFFKEEFGVIAENVSDRNPDFDLAISELDPELAKQRRVVPGKLLKKIFRDSFGYRGKERVTVEVKYDEAAARYKNFFIEVFFDVDTGSPGTVFKCKADLIAWVVPAKKKFKIYLFKRPEFLAWFFQYIFENKKKLQYKTPNISPQARGIAVPIKALASSFACLGVFDFRL